jgi:hypothetical protein
VGANHVSGEPYSFKKVATSGFQTQAFLAYMLRLWQEKGGEYAWRDV